MTGTRRKWTGSPVCIQAYKRLPPCPDIINDSEVAAVAIATPVNTHFEIARACLEGGKHVLLEKPLASSVETGRRTRAPGS